ncbi:hypothetical protein [Amnibacterium setariae]|jgi:hypothetical protein|uniref:Uncharacterized protein n=1 Tax=Amnibacterium setariae TaxID=2306585 RepID=A0A3A1U255_9MICO|nr:hypothetical protein [Amnibacterium setariae]RIX30453.1 hypothetical protein D1781_03220 [Amnibacterium setariae]
MAKFGRFARRLDRGLLPFMGPAQIGAGHPEEPYQRPADAACPVCHRPMTAHRIERNPDPARATRLVCPTDD